MSNNIKITQLVSIVVITTVAACSPTISKQSSIIKSSDKQMTCYQVKMEMYSSKSKLDLAKQSYKPTISDILMPISYAIDYMDAAEDELVANERMEYLGGIYDIMNCNTQNQQIDVYYQQYEPTKIATTYDYRSTKAPAKYHDIYEMTGDWYW